MPKVTSINLLRSSQTHYTDTIIKWALTTGRFLIIVTETIALAAFVYRFTLDRQIIDLGDTIDDNAAIVSLYTEEDTFRNLQERLIFTQELENTPTETTTLLGEFTKLAQGKVTYETLSVAPSVVRMSFTTTSPSSLASFLESIESVPVVRSVSVDRVENSAESGKIHVDATAELIGTEQEEAEDDRG